MGEAGQQDSPRAEEIERGRIGIVCLIYFLLIFVANLRFVSIQGEFLENQIYSRKRIYLKHKEQYIKIRRTALFILFSVGA